MRYICTTTPPPGLAHLISVAFRTHCQHPPTYPRWIVAYTPAKQLAGVAGVCFSTSAIWSLAVYPQHRGQGVGSALLLYACSVLQRRHFLPCVYVDDAALLPFYQSRHFQTVALDEVGRKHRALAKLQQRPTFSALHSLGRRPAAEDGENEK